ncbi:MAG: substrate-binding domain-containing protein [Sporichthyaceae bacterium]
MRRLTGFVIAALLVVSGCTDGDESASAKTLILATTTSTQDSGLLDVLLPAFTRDTGLTVKPVAVGSGQAIELGERGEADVLLVHSPAAEEELVAAGLTGRRLLVMHNDFVVLGPQDDPAGTEDLSAPDIFKKVAESEEVFVSRGDDSGTHTKEKSLWSAAGIEPAGDWYTSTGQGMAATLRIADEREGYTLSDRATFLTQQDTLDLKIVGEGDPELLNVYHVIEMTEKAGDKVRTGGAVAFADWIVSASAQQLIGDFGKAEYGQSLFTPDAGKDPDDLAA